MVTAFANYTFVVTTCSPSYSSRVRSGLSASCTLQFIVLSTATTDLVYFWGVVGRIFHNVVPRHVHTLVKLLFQKGVRWRQHVRLLVYNYGLTGTELKFWAVGRIVRYTITPWAVWTLTLSFNELRMLVPCGHDVVNAMRSYCTRGTERAEAQAPQQGTRSQHAATSLASQHGTQPSATGFHRVLARPVFEPPRGRTYRPMRRESAHFRRRWFGRETAPLTLAVVFFLFNFLSNTTLQSNIWSLIIIGTRIITRFYSACRHFERSFSNDAPSYNVNRYILLYA